MGNGAKGICPHPRSLRIPTCLFVRQRQICLAFGFPSFGPDTLKHINSIHGKSAAIRMDVGKRRFSCFAPPMCYYDVEPSSGLGGFHKCAAYWIL